ncbi:uncharacterized protein LOC125378521 [Haliotis rufescens]|uniref:uncharacterized protein LOC125376155 n=1 Tax=Haliotis rufescens TaxID=6454 RepID=UPI00201E8520|nr:uncharacterized protein LOC125376155 [Haliotis rufescens]XP_048249898.1 uncharacterized protein LOC125378521 [Haliotis rufescens]
MIMKRSRWPLSLPWIWTRFPCSRLLGHQHPRKRFMSTPQGGHRLYVLNGWASHRFEGGPPLRDLKMEELEDGRGKRGRVIVVVVVVAVVVGTCKALPPPLTFRISIVSGCDWFFS